MNTKKFLVSVVAVFIFTHLFEWYFHGTCLEGIYIETESLWRSQEEMFQKFHWLIFSQVIVAILFCYMFVKGYENKGLDEGIRFGAIAGAFISAPAFTEYAVIPYPLELISYWVLGALFEFIVAGAIIALIYKPKAS